MSSPSNQSHGYNTEVHGTIGDETIVDQFELHSTAAYSGSIADDIVIPAASQAGHAFISVSNSQFRGENITGATTMMPQFEFPPTNWMNNGDSSGYSDYIPASLMQTNWIFMNEKCFEDKTDSEGFGLDLVFSDDGNPRPKPTFTATVGGDVLAGDPPSTTSFMMLSHINSLFWQMWPVTTNNLYLNIGGSDSINPSPAQYARAGGGLSLIHI